MQPRNADGPDDGADAMAACRDCRTLMPAWMLTAGLELLPGDRIDDLLLCAACWLRREGTCDADT
jgi:hypothetical protein